MDWSPDGSRFVYYSFVDGARTIFEMNADGSNPTRLTPGPESNRSPAWSRDGQYIVYSSVQGANQELIVMRADGSEPTRITNTPGNEGLPDWN